MPDPLKLWSVFVLFQLNLCFEQSGLWWNALGNAVVFSLLAEARSQLLGLADVLKWMV